MAIFSITTDKETAKIIAQLKKENEILKRKIRNYEAQFQGIARNICNQFGFEMNKRAHNPTKEKKKCYHCKGDPKWRTNCINPDCVNYAT